VLSLILTEIRGNVPAPPERSISMVAALVTRTWVPEEPAERIRSVAKVAAAATATATALLAELDRLPADQPW
jgi:hypothetical protein